jgi:tetratricopeptide (TPR) repeat protein
MGRSGFLAFHGRMMLALVGGALVLSGAYAEDAELRKKVLELNQVTGANPLQAKAQKLLANPAETKKLLAEAQAIAKEKKQSFNYNGALILAQVAQDLKDLAAAEVFYRICMEEAARLQSPKKLLESFGGLIDAFYENKKFAESARVCRELLELKTDDGKPRIVLIAVTTRFGETDFIEDDSFDTAKRLRPGVHRLLIQAITKQGKFDKAIELVDSLIKTNDHWLERQLKGWVLREAGKFEEAAKIYEDVIDRIAKDQNIGTEDRDEYQERYRYALSSIYIDMNNVDKAAQELQKLLEKKPNDPGYNNDLGYVWADHDMNLDKAEKLIRKALDLDRQRRKSNPNLLPEEDRDNGAYLDSLGWVLFKQKKLPEARDALLKAVEDKRSQHIEIYDHLGDVYMALGDKEAAMNAWRKGLEVVGEGRRDQERKALVEKKLEKVK